MRFAVGPIALAALLMTTSIRPVEAQMDSREGIALRNEIYQLRQELRSLEDQLSHGGGSASRAPAYAPPQPSASNDLVAQLLTRVDALEEQVRQLRGQIDETQNQVQHQNQDFSKRLDDLAFQLNPQGGASAALPPPYANPPQYGGPDANNGPPPAPDRAFAPLPPASARPSGPRTPEAAMREGNAALARRDYAAAEGAAREVLASRTSPRAYDAQFLLAQALAGERQYPQAAVAYDDVYNRSRTGSHAQDARLGLASSLTAINEKKAACDVLSRMRTEFPQLRPDIGPGMAAIGQKAGCR